VSPPSDALKALGLTGAMVGTVSCGPCLNYAIGDTGRLDDTGDTGDTGEAGTEAADPATRVLDRGVLPADVAALLSRRLATRAGGAE